ncbi:MAG TPA: aminopeptidase P family protein, partial [Sphingomonadales bacterium]|nr:aminopeptidase P family protein [Sphingomonadales bacterium]
MTLGVGGSTAETELARLSDMTAGLAPIGPDEYTARLNRAQQIMQDQGIAALYAHAGTSMTYFTGTVWHPSERMVGALIPAEGEVSYICPTFEVGTLTQYMVTNGPVHSWEEHESPYDLFRDMLHNSKVTSGTIALDESCPFFISNGIALAAPDYGYINGDCITAAC